MPALERTPAPRFMPKTAFDAAFEAAFEAAVAADFAAFAAGALLGVFGALGAFSIAVAVIVGALAAFAGRPDRFAAGDLGAEAFAAGAFAAGVFAAGTFAAGDLGAEAF